MSDPGLELLLACTRSRFDGAAKERAEGLLSRVSDWNALADRAGRHGLLPLLGHNLDALGSAVPVAAGAVLDRARASARHSCFLLQETVRLVKLFEEHSLRAVPFKGPLLGESVYGSAALRQAGDVDLFFRAQEVPAAKKILTARGYSSHIPIPPHLEDAYVRHYYAYNLVGERNNAVVDLHWELGRSFFPRSVSVLDYEGRLEKLSLEGTEIPLLSAADHLLLLCLHGSRHRWERLLWVVDVAEMVRAAEDMDWETLFREAERISAVRALASGLFLAGGLLDAELPERAARYVERVGAARQLASEVEQSVASTGKKGSLSVAAKKAFYQVRSLDRAWDRVRFCVLWTLTPNVNDWLWIRLPEPLTALYAVLRPFRMAVAYGRKAISG